MVSDYKKKSYQKYDIVIISGVSIDRTPVVKSFIDHYSNKNIVTLEYQHKKRLSFLLNGLRLIKQYRHGRIFFVGIQSLPIIFIAQIFLEKFFYWELESYSISDNNSLVIKMLYFQSLINWSKVNLILPDETRWNNRDERTVKRKLIIPNVPLSGKLFQQRTLNENDKINLIFYGNLDNNYVYVKEWIDFAKKNSNVFLSLIGWNFDKRLLKGLPNNIDYKPQITHDELLAMLNNYHFSIVGYRPIDFNHKYCAPNKLYEAFSFSIPVIANIKNPTLSSLINETGTGILIDFDSDICSQFNIDNIKSNYNKYSLNAFNVYINKFNFEYFAKTQLDPVIK